MSLLDKLKRNKVSDSENNNDNLRQHVTRSQNEPKHTIRLEDELARLYAVLGNTIDDAIPVQWSKAYLLGEVEKNAASYSTAFYYQENENAPFVFSHNIPETYDVSLDVYYDMLKRLNDCILAIYKCFFDHKQDLWDQLWFSIDSSGKFSVNFKYHQLEKGIGPLNRQLVWAFEVLHQEPDDPYLIEELKKSLK